MTLPADTFAPLASRELQTYAARLVQDAFARLFRLSLEGSEAEWRAGAREIAVRAEEWIAAAEGGRDGEAGILRRAMLLAGLDQWGLAYAQIFGPSAMAGLSELVGLLRDALDPAGEGRCQAAFSALQDNEGDAIDFKVGLRRDLHLAIWHAMIASEERDEAFAILSQLGGMMAALTRTMPEVGWRLVADALAHIQIRCLAHRLASDGLGQETTQALFGALSRELPKPQWEQIMAQATQAVLGWQEASRGAAGEAGAAGQTLH